MKREIKFRRYFQHEETGAISVMEWGCIDYKKQSVTDFSAFTTPGLNNRAYPIADCQLTGLKDKNGKEIWEGDIVETDEGGWIGKVIFDAAQFMVIDELGGYSAMVNWQNCEVIGNQFENPELLQP